MHHRAPLWLPAAPFRSHVTHLMTASGLPWRAVALAASVPPALVRSLLLGRDGRPRTKIHRVAATNLMSVTVDDLTELRSRVVSAQRLRRLIDRLHRHGFTTDEVGHQLRLTPEQVRAVTSGKATTSDAYTTLLARAACDARCPNDLEGAYLDTLMAA